MAPKPEPRVAKKPAAAEEEVGEALAVEPVRKARRSNSSAALVATGEAQGSGGSTSVSLVRAQPALASGSNVSRLQTRMVNSLKYHVEEGKHVDKKADAERLLRVYEAIVGNSPGAIEQRRKFLEDFEQHGSGKGKDGLKWTVSFEKTARSEDTKSVATTENFLTRHRFVF